MADDDAFDWDVDRVVQELCTEERTWTPRSSKVLLPDPVQFEALLREHEIHGVFLLCDLNVKLLNKTMGIKILGRCFTVMHAVEDLRSRSRKYAQHIRQHGGMHRETLGDSLGVVGNKRLSDVASIDETDLPDKRTKLEHEALPTSIPSPISHNDLVLNTIAPGAANSNTDEVIPMSFTGTLQSPETNHIDCDHTSIETTLHSPVAQPLVTKLNVDLPAVDQDMTNLPTRTILDDIEPASVTDTGQNSGGRIENFDTSTTEVTDDTPPAPHFELGKVYEVNGRKRLVPFLISDFSTTTTAEAISDVLENQNPTAEQSLPHLEPGQVYTVDGRKRMMPVLISAPKTIDLVAHTDLTSSTTIGSGSSSRNIAATLNAVGPSATIANDTSKDVEDMAQVMMKTKPCAIAAPYCGRARIPIDQLFFENDADPDLFSDAEAEEMLFVVSGSNIAPGRQQYVANAMKSFLRSIPAFFERLSEEVAAVVPYNGNHVLKYVPSQQQQIQIYRRTDNGSITVSKEDASRWPMLMESSLQSRMVFKQARQIGDPGTFEAMDFDYLQSRYETISDDEVLPVYGESDSENEFDFDLWTEIQKENGGEIEMLSRSTRKKFMTVDEVNAAIDEEIASLVEEWTDRHPEKRERKAYYLWQRARKMNDRRSTIKRHEDHVQRLNDERLPKLREEILQGQWTRAKQVRQQTRSMEQSVIDREDLLWQISVLKQRTSPVKPDPDRQRRPWIDDPIGHVLDGEPVNSTLESASSDEEMDDFVVSDDVDAEDEMITELEHECDAGGYRQTAQESDQMIDDAPANQTKTPNDSGLLSTIAGEPQDKIVEVDNLVKMSDSAAGPTSMRLPEDEPSNILMDMEGSLSPAVETTIRRTSEQPTDVPGVQQVLPSLRAKAADRSNERNQFVEKTKSDSTVANIQHTNTKIVASREIIEISSDTDVASAKKRKQFTDSDSPLKEFQVPDQQAERSLMRQPQFREPTIRPPEQEPIEVIDDSIGQEPDHTLTTLPPYDDVQAIKKKGLPFWERLKDGRRSMITMLAGRAITRCRDMLERMTEPPITLHDRIDDIMQELLQGRDDCKDVTPAQHMMALDLCRLYFVFRTGRRCSILSLKSPLTLLKEATKLLGSDVVKFKEFCDATIAALDRICSNDVSDGSVETEFNRQNKAESFSEDEGGPASKNRSRTIRDAAAGISDGEGQSIRSSARRRRLISRSIYESSSSPKRRTCQDVIQEDNTSVTNDDDDTGPVGLIPPSSSAKRRKRAIRRDPTAARMQVEEADRDKEQDQRRAALHAKLTSSAAGVDVEAGRIIINDAKQDEDGFIYVNKEIAKYIKPHQINGVRFLWQQIMAPENAKSRGCLLAHTMGLGKTMQTITLLVAIAEASASSDPTVKRQVPAEMQDARTLILCPPGLIDNWMDELWVWAPRETLGILRKIDATIRPESRATEIKLWAEDGGVLVMGYEMLRNLLQNKPTANRPATLSEDEHEQMKAWLWQGATLVVADEAHRMKNAASALTQVTAQFNTLARISLTGSPLANNVLEYHAMIEWVAPGFLGPLNEFKQYFVEPIQEGCYADSEAREKQLSRRKLGVLNKLLQPKVNRADMSVLSADLPPKTEFVLFVTLTDLQLEAYSTYVRIMMASDYDLTGGGKMKQSTIWHWLAILSLLCNHPDCFRAKLDPSSEDTKTVRNAGAPDGDEDDDIDVPVYKAGLTQELVDAELELFSKVSDMRNIALSNKAIVLDQLLTFCKAANEKVLVFTGSLPTLDFLQQMCKHKHRRFARLDGKTPIAKRQEHVKNFNTGKTEVYLISTAAGGLGLNLPGASRVVIYDFRFNPVLEEQAIGRAYRIGQQKPVFVYRFVTGGTFETRMHEQRVFKQHLAVKVVDKKNNRSTAMRIAGQFLQPPIDFEQQDVSHAMGRDPLVLDHILQGKVADIRNIVLDDTYRVKDKELTAEDIAAIEAEHEEEQLKRSDPERYARNEAEKIRAAQRADVTQRSMMYSWPAVPGPNYVQDYRRRPAASAARQSTHVDALTAVFEKEPQAQVQGSSAATPIQSDNPGSTFPGVAIPPKNRVSEADDQGTKAKPRGTDPARVPRGGSAMGQNPRPPRGTGSSNAPVMAGTTAEWTKAHATQNLKLMDPRKADRPEVPVLSNQPIVLDDTPEPVRAQKRRKVHIPSPQVEENVPPSASPGAGVMDRLLNKSFGWWSKPDN